MGKVKVLKASPYFWEKVKDIDLAKRHCEGKLSFMLLNQLPLCDVHCKRCFMPEERRTMALNKTLRADEWFEIVDKGKEKGLLSIEISGEGEPFVSSTTIAIIKYANSLGIPTTTITNGHLISEEIMSILLDEEATLVFSLHTLDEEKYEKDNCLMGSFRTKIRAIDLAAKLFNGSTYVEQGIKVHRLAIHMTLQQDNIEEIDSIRQFCHERRMLFSIAPFASSGNGTLHPELIIKRDISDVTALGDSSIIHSKTSSSIYDREVCGTAAFGMSIGFDGNLLLDAHGSYEINDTMGNVRTNSFEEIFQKWQNVVREMFEKIEGFCPIRDQINFEKFVSGIKNKI